MASTEFLPHWPFLLGLVLLLVVSAGIWYNLNGIAKRFPQLISSPQRWLAGFAVALLASSVGILGYQVISQNLGTDGLEWTSLRWSCIAVAGINGIWYGISLRSLLGHSENTREQLIQKQLLMQSVSQAQQNVLLKEQVRETKRRHLKSR